MVIKVDQDKCVGCGRCTEMCPDTFHLSETGIAEVISQDDVECAKTTVDECPQEAIEVDEE